MEANEKSPLINRDPSVIGLLNNEETRYKESKTLNAVLNLTNDEIQTNAEEIVTHILNATCTSSKAKTKTEGAIRYLTIGRTLRDLKPKKALEFLSDSKLTATLS